MGVYGALRGRGSFRRTTAKTRLAQSAAGVLHPGRKSYCSLRLCENKAGEYNGPRRHYGPGKGYSSQMLPREV